MHPQMPQPQYLPHSYAPFSSPHVQPSGHSVPHSSQGFLFNPYDQSNYAQDPYVQFDLSKPVTQFQYLSNGQPANTGSQHHSTHSQSPQMNNYVLSSSTPMTLYQNAGPQRRSPPQQFAPENSSSTPTGPRQRALRVPKFDRTYTDAIEDELYDETIHNSAPNSAQHNSRVSSSSYAFQNMDQYSGQLYVDKSTGAMPNGASSSQQSHLVLQPPRNSQLKVAGGPRYGNAYDPLHHSQQMSSTAVADSVRRLKGPTRTTVSPREAFLDYPDNADFREKRLFSSSTSPYSNGRDSHEISGHQTSESCESNDHDLQLSDSPATTPSMPGNSTPYLLDPKSTSRPHTLAVSSSRSNSTSTRQSGLPSSDASQESSNSSESEYAPAATRRASRSSGRGSIHGKTFTCVDCGKRFDKSQTLQTHRRNSHGKTPGVPTLSGLKLSNTSHRCDFVDLTTGRTCDTVFSRP
jgi:hypothetical protein